MKKILLLTIAAAISLGSIAQGNSNRAHQKHKKEKKAKHRNHDDDRTRDDDWRNRDSRDGDWRNRDRDDDDRRHDDDRRNRDTRNGDWRTGRNGNDRNDNGRYDQNSSQAPRKVKDAFYRDYPNSSNVTWTKDRGVWTARFKRSGLFGGNTTVSYRANGERVNNNNNNGVFSRRS